MLRYSLVLLLMNSACLLLCALPTLALAAEEGRKEHPPETLIDPTLQLPTGRTLVLVQNQKGSRRIYAATETGLFMSTDGGYHWASRSLPEGLTDGIFAVASNPLNEQVLYIGGRAGVWQSKDGGVTWHPLQSAPSAQSVPRAMAAGGIEAQTIYVATDQHGIFRSDDGGVSWVSVNSGLPEAPAGGRPELVRSLAVDPKAPLIAYAATELHGVYKTTDGGASWLPVNKGMGPFPLPHSVSGPHLLMSSLDPERLLVLLVRPVHSHLTQTLLFQSSNGGDRWFSLEVEFPLNVQGLGLAEDPLDPQRVLVFTTDGTLGVSWKEIEGVEVSEKKP